MTAQHLLSMTTAQTIAKKAVFVRCGEVTKQDVGGEPAAAELAQQR
jgi:hypothetical protein